MPSSRTRTVRPSYPPPAPPSRSVAAMELLGRRRLSPIGKRRSARLPARFIDIWTLGRFGSANLLGGRTVGAPRPLEIGSTVSLAVGQSRRVNRPGGVQKGAKRLANCFWVSGRPCVHSAHGAPKALATIRTVADNAAPAQAPDRYGCAFAPTRQRGVRRPAQPSCRASPERRQAAWRASWGHSAPARSAMATSRSKLSIAIMQLAWLALLDRGAQGRIR